MSTVSAVVFCRRATQLDRHCLEVFQCSQDARAKETEIERQKEELRSRMQARKEAIERNAQIEKDLDRLRERHGMERKIQQRQADERRERKAAKERRRAGRDAMTLD